MADVRVTPQQIAITGITPTYTGSLSTSDRYLVDNNERIFLHVKNGGGSPCNVTINTPGSVDSLAVAERVVAVAAAGEAMIGPFAGSVYNQPNSNDLAVTFSFITTVTVAAFRL